MDGLSKVWDQLGSLLRFQLCTLEQTPVTAGTALELVVLVGLLFYLTPKLNSFIVKRLHQKQSISNDIRKPIIRLSRAALFLFGLVCILHLTGIDTWVFKQLYHLYRLLQSAVDLNLFKLGHTQITLLAAFYMVSLSWILVRATSRLPGFVSDRVLGKTKMDLGMRQTIGSLVHYMALFVGFIILLQTVGIDLSALTVLLGALGIGISFGLQTVTTNFISGLIIMFERPIKLGDRIQIGDITGEVVDISLRATTVVTNEGISIFVPNSQFVTSNVVNWTHNGRTVGLKFPINLSMKSDPKAVQQTILEAVKNCRGVLPSPPPLILLDEIAGESMKFSIRVWTKEYFAFPDTLRSELNLAISGQLKNSGLDVSMAA